MGESTLSACIVRRLLSAHVRVAGTKPRTIFIHIASAQLHKESQQLISQKKILSPFYGRISGAATITIKALSFEIPTVRAFPRYTSTHCKNKRKICVRVADDMLMSRVHLKIVRSILLTQFDFDGIQSSSAPLFNGKQLKKELLGLIFTPRVKVDFPAHVAASARYTTLTDYEVLKGNIRFDLLYVLVRTNFNLFMRTKLEIDRMRVSFIGIGKFAFCPTLYCFQTDRAKRWPCGWDFLLTWPSIYRNDIPPTNILAFRI